jgi:hypothetical protein
MPRARRRLRNAVLSLLLAAGLVWGLSRYFLDPQRLAFVFAERLETAYGGRVGISAANVGIGSSNLNDLQLFELGAGSNDPAWLTVRTVSADLSAWRMLCGERKPKALILDGAAITLRLDETGHLLTRLPGPSAHKESLPHFHLTRCRVTLQQQGHPQFIVRGVEGTLTDDGQTLTLSGAIEDDTWGKWRFSGRLEKATAVLHFEMTTTGVHVTQKMLDELPFVPAKTWQHVQCEGDTPATVEVKHTPVSGAAPGQLTKEGFHYRIVLDPTATSVYITRINLHAEQARGHVVIADKVVYLENVKGLASDGELRTKGELDFRVKPAQMHYDVQAERIDLHQLPQTWPLPVQIRQKTVSGRLTGRADLHLVVVDGKAQTRGEGEGEVTDTRVLGIPLRKPVKLTLHADGAGFVFRIRGVPVPVGIGSKRPDSALPMSLPRSEPKP